ncbi:flagellar protein FlaG [Marinobacter nauticus]|uniref:flagellar protein FlaG n=1 Tax=Marinobacter nauticus TaxID=2743 RepID=UPI001C942657|nr:flagellar protein FlaG [Marinobacter nauticus]MBY6104761.1 flagellar protein FlaG [Marinobacter nauticus]
MNDVNLNSPDLKLVRSSEQAPARATASPQNEGSNVSAQASTSGKPLSVANAPAVQAASGSARLKEQAAEQRESLDDAVSRLNDYAQNVQRDLQFEIDNDLGQTIVRVVDQQTQEVIRQIPDEVALRLAEKLQQDEPLTLFSVKV